MDVVSYVLAKKQANNVGFPEDARSGKVLSIDANGNRVWSYPLIMDATLTEGYQAVFNSYGIPQELLVVDVARPQFGTFIMKPGYFTYMRIKNGNTILVNSQSLGGIIDKIEIESIDESGIKFLGINFNGHTTRYYYSITENTWDTAVISYSGSRLETLFAEKIDFNNETEFTPVGDYNPATKKYVDDIVKGIQSDWNQSDPNAPDYVKNRPFYSKTISETASFHITGSSGDSNPVPVSNEFIAAIFKRPHTVIVDVNIQGNMVRSSIVINNGTNVQIKIPENASILRYLKVIIRDDLNGKVLAITSEGLIWDTCDITVLHEEIYTLDEKYLPKSIARVNDIDEAATADSEIIDVLIQEDMLFAFTDSTGSILTDENNNILTW